VRALLMPVVVAVGLVPVTGQVHKASADSFWSNGVPVFQSDLERREARLERERAKRRKRYSTKRFPAFMKGGGKPDIEPREPEVISLAKDERPGQIIIDTKGRRLFYTLPGNRAYLYPISVGRQGFTWTGRKRISRVAEWPTWTPPPEMRRREPGLPRVMTGGINNPLGAKALYLGASRYRIHGTNDPGTIGRAASSGCFRMMNEHVAHLASVAKIGTLVRVKSNYAGAPGVVATVPGERATPERFSAATFFN